MKRAITILTCVLAVGMAAAQSPQIIQNTRAIMQGVQANETRATNQALGITAQTAPVASKGATVPKAPVVHTAPKATPVKPSAMAKTSAPALKVAPAVAVKPASGTPVAKVVPAVAKTSPTAAKPAPASPAAEPSKNADQKEMKWAMTGKRDPFVSPVVYQTGVSNCTGGKKCLEIGAISLRGVVHSDNGFIAVVTNSMNKAYFLRENDPVFDGYVVKITGDSIVFQETQQDRLGKTFTKEVVKKLTTPSV
jgi:hypothetical protein